MPRVLAAVLVCAALGAAVQAAPSVRVLTVDGSPIDPLDAPTGTTAIVFLFTSVDCPVSNRYAPEVRRIAERFAPAGVHLRLVYPGKADDAAAIRNHMRAFSYEGAAAALRDPELALSKFTGATITPEAVVYANGRVAYRGRIDDRYVDLTVERPAATTHDLADALAAVVAGKPVAHPVTQAVGCYIADLAR